MKAVSLGQQSFESHEGMAEIATVELVDVTDRLLRESGRWFGSEGPIPLEIVGPVF